MTSQTQTTTAPPASPDWLKAYYFTRAAVSVIWVAAAFTVGRASPAASDVLFVLYPAWDAAANLADAQRNGGLRRSPTQTLNAGVSLVTAVAVAIAATHGANAVLAVIGVWAALAGLLQLATAVRRWKTYGAQWAMALSGAQSALAGAIFLRRATAAVTPDAASIAPYALFGAFYFLVSAIWLTVTQRRRRGAGAAAA